MSDRDSWRVAWEGRFGKPYGDMFFARATGELPEMESSKAAARRLAAMLKDGDSLLDVGCGAGHYYRSIRNTVSRGVRYTGIDATRYYIDRAREAYAADASARFEVGDIFALDLPARSFDVVLCANVLLHLPTVARPLSELCRVTRRQLLIRTLVASTSYVVKDVAPQPDGDEFDADGAPREFHYLNIYGEAYLRRLLQGTPGVHSVAIELDRDFDAARLADTAKALPDAWDATRVIDGMQVTGPILMPWRWIAVTFDSSQR